MVGLFVMPSSTIFRQHTRLNAATNKTTKKISHTRRSLKDRNYPSTPFDKLPFLEGTPEYFEWIPFLQTIKQQVQDERSYNRQKSQYILIQLNPKM